MVSASRGQLLTKMQCSKCQRIFSTTSHLRRHELIHTRVSLLKCLTCDRGFLRSDALRRHSKKCDPRGDRDEVPEGQRGRKRRSCIPCHDRKARCDNNQPCQRCATKSIICSYSQRENDPKEYSNAADIIDPVSLLRDLTDSQNSTIELLDTEETFPEQVIEYSENYPLHNLLFNEDCADMFSGHLWNPSQDLELTNNLSTPFSGHEDLSNGFQARIAQLVTELSNHFIAKRQLQARPVLDFPIHLAWNSLTATNAMDYIAFYFHRSHAQCPVIHRPTFDYTRASSPLLIAVILCGSVHYPPRDDALSTRRLLDYTEEYIYDKLRDKMPSLQENNEEDIELIQAAAIIIGQQNNSKDVEVRKRIRLERHPDLVACIRHLGFTYIKREAPLNAAGWQAFIYMEIRLRLGLCVYVFDCQWAVYYNRLPQLGLNEVQLQLCCSDELFEISTPEEFGKAIADSRISSLYPLPSIKDCISDLLADKSAVSEHLAVLRTEPRHLMLVMLGLHSVILAAQANLLASSTVIPLARALCRWKELWDFACEFHRERKSFHRASVKIGIEFWWLANKILELTRAGEIKCRYLSRTPTDHLDDLHEFIQLYAKD